MVCTAPFRFPAVRAAIKREKLGQTKMQEMYLVLCTFKMCLQYIYSFLLLYAPKFPLASIKSILILIRSLFPIQAHHFVFITAKQGFV